MIKEIVKMAFLQAQNETPNLTKTGLSKHVAKKIEENNQRKIFSYKTFTRYYDKYLLNKDGIICHPQTEIIEELCKYLGYENYQHFVSVQKGNVLACPNSVENNSVSQTKAIPLHVTKTVETIEKSVTNVLTKHKGLMKQALFFVAFILLSNNNWREEECLPCEQAHNKNLDYKKTGYDGILFQNTTEETNTTFPFFETNDLCYGLHKKTSHLLINKYD